MKDQDFSELTVHLSDEQIKEFQKLYKQKFGESISQEEAYKRALSLVRLFKILLSPDVEETKKEPS